MYVFDENSVPFGSNGPPMRVKGPAVVRFERRWGDYCDVLERGTNPAVGVAEPRPPDEREGVLAILKRAAPDAVQEADCALDAVWKADRGAWQRRLRRPFLETIGPSVAFADLIEDGCQADTLAFHFHQAAHPEALSTQERQVRTDVDHLDKLARGLRQALVDFTDGRRKFDEYLSAHQLRVSEDEPGGAMLKMIRVDLEDELTNQQDDLRRIRRQIDRRRQPLLGHALVRLSLQIHAVTGSYHYAEVAAVFNAFGNETITFGNLKKRRKRRQS